jgi:hypothetical protein
MNRIFPGILVALLALAACAAPGGTPGGSEEGSAGGSPSPSEDGGAGGSIEHPTGDEPVLVVEEVGGFAMPQMLATRVPTFVLLGDGRVIMQGAQTLEFPGPALPPLIERSLNEQGIQEVLQAVQATGMFGSDRHLRGAMNFIADATDTVFRVNAGGRSVAVSVYGLGLLDPSVGAPENMNAAEVEAHATLSALRDWLMTLDAEIGAEGWETEGWQPYEPDAFRLYVRDVTGEPREGDLQGQVREWPTDEDPAAFGEEQEGFGDGTRCGVVEGETAGTWYAELSQANQNTLWTDGGERRFSVQPRPLLPHEEPTCPELFGA